MGDVPASETDAAVDVDMEFKVETDDPGLVIGALNPPPHFRFRFKLLAPSKNDGALEVLPVENAE